VQRLCEAFGLHRSSYRVWRNRDIAPSVEEQELLQKMVDALAVSNGSAGARSIAKMVTQAGIMLRTHLYQMPGGLTDNIP